MHDVEPGTATAYGTLPDGRDVQRYVLAHGTDIRVGILTYGGIIESLEVPDASGQLASVVLGYPDLAGYVAAPSTYFGSIIGRYANRIAQGTFVLDEQRYSLAINNPPNTLHGGGVGFDRLVWDVVAATPTSLCLSTVSAAGSEGYPGNLNVQVTYSLDADGAFHIAYLATTDAPTVVNLTNHTYFNLGGEASGDILDHVLIIDAAHYTPVDRTFIPTGEIAAVAGTPFDFRGPHAIGERIRQADPQLVIGLGYDHNWVLDRTAGDPPSRAASARDPASGRILDVLTTEPGVQFYSGNFLTGSEVGRGGRAYRQSAGFALETQHFPDSPNQPSFPTTVVRPGATYRSETIWRFSVASGGLAHGL